MKSKYSNKALVIACMQIDHVNDQLNDEYKTQLNTLIRKFETVLFINEWHNENHISFSYINENDSHCIKDTSGASIPEWLDLSKSERVYFIKTGQNDTDSNDPFIGNNKEIVDLLENKGIETLIFCGLNHNNIIMNSVLSSKKLGFNSCIYLDLCLELNFNKISKDSWDKTKQKLYVEELYENSVKLYDKSDLFLMNI